MAPRSVQKPIRVIWSKLAVKTAGPGLFQLHARFLDEAAAVITEASGQFVHAIRDDPEPRCYLFRAEELAASWRVFAQLAEYRPMFTIRDDHPDPKMRGKIFKYPHALEDPENDRFINT